MKKILTLLLVISTLSVYSQSIKHGIHGGVNFSSMNYQHTEMNTNYNINLMTECMSVEEFADLSFNVFPNPTKSVINLNITHKIKKVSILNTKAQLIKEFNIQNTEFTRKYQFNVGELSSGLYFLKIETLNKIKIIYKFLKI